MNTQPLDKLPASITIPRWFDRHAHFRDDDNGMLNLVLPYTVNQRTTGAVIMGNLLKDNHTYSIEKTLAYRKRIEAALSPGSDFNPRMTLYLTDYIDPEEVERGFSEGVWCGAKLYMADKNGQGGTTNSAHGVRDLLRRYKVFETMERIGMPLFGHFEAAENEVDEFDREVTSMDRDLKPLIKSFPGLSIVVEHVTDGRMAEFIAQVDHPIHATVTAHHLMMNRNWMFSGGMNPVNYCKPVPKREEHRRKVRQLVTSGNVRFGAGTDTAPHDKSNKSKCCGCAAGIFTAPMAVEMYTTVFDEDSALGNLGAFLSKNFVELYGMKVGLESMTIERQEWKIPEYIMGSGTDSPAVMVFNGGQTLPWKLVS